jgi:hypothetical protein
MKRIVRPCMHLKYIIGQVEYYSDAWHATDGECDRIEKQSVLLDHLCQLSAHLAAASDGAAFLISFCPRNEAFSEL